MGALALQPRPAKIASRTNPAPSRCASARRPVSHRGDWEKPRCYDRAASSGSVTGNGRRQTLTDANGNLGNDGVRALTYDYDDRLAQVVQGMGAAQTTAALAYYPGGELQQLAVTTASSGTTTATQFLYDGDQMVGEYNSGVLLRRYVRGADADEPLVWYDSSDGFQRRWLHADERGSIIGWSDGSGVMRATFTYGPYGEPSSWAGTRFAYTGQMALPEVTLYHYKARVYDPVFGHFLQTDPTGYEGGANLYAYVEDDPTDLDDPAGESSRPGAGGGGNGWIHAGLAVASFCPWVCGSAFSAVDGGLYAAEGHGVSAGISFAAAGIGLFSDAGGAKLLGFGAKAGLRAGESEALRFIGQGFNAGQAEHLAATYTGVGHHFIPQRAGIPSFVGDSSLNVLKPSGISRGKFYELHYKVDSHFYGAAFPKSVGGSWRGSSLGLNKYNGAEKLWYSSPALLKLTAGRVAAQISIVSSEYFGGN